MRQTEILRLAYTAQVGIWAKEKEFLEASPESNLCQGRERIANERLDEIRSLWLQAEQEEKELVKKLSTDLRLLCNDVIAAVLKCKEGEIDNSTYIKAKEKYIEEAVYEIIGYKE